MANVLVRQDPFEFTGTVVSVNVPFQGALGQDQSNRRWTVSVEPAAGHEAAARNANGVTNLGGTVACTVAVDDAVVGWSTLASLLYATTGQSVRILGTLCDDADTGVSVVYPVGILATERPIEVYDIGGWPTAVKDFDLLAFAHAPEALQLGEPHAGENRALSIRLPFPYRPSDDAEPFHRAYRSTMVDAAQSVAFDVVDQGGVPLLDVKVLTGAPADGKGFFSAQIGLTFEEPDLAQYCPYGTCDHDAGTYCSYDGRTRYMRIPPHVPAAQAGDLVVSPGDGRGLISGIVASLEPSQVFDHMGMFVDNGWTIRHCTASPDRLEDDGFYTYPLFFEVAGVDVIDERIPLNGLRPDLLRYVWPGSITQTVEEVFRNGRNSRNSRWSFGATHPGRDVHDPDIPGAPFFIYHLPPAARARRLEFNDPERDRSETISRLQEQPVTIGAAATTFRPLLVRPHGALDRSVRPSLRSAASEAVNIDAHYRFFAYSAGDICRDASWNAPDAGDPRWQGLPGGAAWAAGSRAAMCSSFVWCAIQDANDLRPAGTPPIVLEDRVGGEIPARGLEYAAKDGFYRYHKKERQEAATGLVNKLTSKIAKRFDDKIPDGGYIVLPVLGQFRDLTAQRVANQTANAFAFDACEALDARWQQPGESESASPDDVTNFWDLKPVDGRPIQHPEGGLAAYGRLSPVVIAKPRWDRVELFRKVDVDPGRGHVTGVAFIAGRAVADVTVRFDFGCATAMTTDDRQTSFQVELEAGTHFAEAFIELPNPATGQLETFQTTKPLQFQVVAGGAVRIVLELEPPSDLWRIVTVHIDADIHDKSFFGGDADAHHFIMDPTFELRQDLEDEPGAPPDQRNTVLHVGKVWRTEPEVGSGVHVAVSVIADLNPTDRSVKCHCEVALLDTDSGGFLGIGTSNDVDQLEVRDVTVPADGTRDVLVAWNFSSDEDVPERATISVSLTNRRRPS